MILATLTILLSASAACSDSPGAQHPATTSAIQPSMEALYRQGIEFNEFLGAATSRADLWKSNYHAVMATDVTLSRARMIGGEWKLLVVTVSGCSDSANTIPYLAQLVDSMPGVEMRIIDSTVGKAVMESHRTPDGRGATPTVILLNSRYEEAGCWIERPSALQRWYMENQATLSGSELLRQKMAWYERDMGAETLREIIEMMEAAAAGRHSCATQDTSAG